MKISLKKKILAKKTSEDKLKFFTQKTLQDRSNKTTTRNLTEARVKAIIFFLHASGINVAESSPTMKELQDYATTECLNAVTPW